MALAETLLELQQLTERLRRDCPWDREQTARTIVPHTVEEAYEVADAALTGDRAKLLDELGDLLFQVYFLALLLEEQGDGDLEQVARAVHAKLMRRHPHVFGDREAETAADVLRDWDQIKRDVEGAGELFGSVPETLPSTLYAKKILRRARSAGHEWAGPGDDPGERLLAAVRDAAEAGVDPELALRQAADRFRNEVESS